MKNKVNTRSDEDWDNLNSELKRVRSELDKANKDLEHFAYVVSHDLREPLRMVLKFTELIIKRFRKAIGNDADEYLGFITEGIQRMQLIISDLLKYSKINTTNREYSETDCNQVLGKVLLTLQPIIKDTKSVITVGQLPTVLGNSTALFQLFESLLDNAIKFRKESVELAIDIRCKDDEKFWIICIKDNGIGIDQKFKDKIFIIFQRLHNSKAYPGSGSGLAICKRIVELHGGEIWVESEPGAGASFYFTLPKIQVANSPKL